MNTCASASYSRAVPMPQIDSLAKLRAALEPHAQRPLVFIYADKRIAAGYHLTEVKAAQFSSLDCGANPETWRETIIQLWDTNEGGEAHMPAGKFLGILSHVAKRLELDDDGLLIFECGDFANPMQVFTIGAVTSNGAELEVTLAPRPATCKPRERGLAELASASEPARGAAAPSCCS